MCHHDVDEQPLRILLGPEIKQKVCERDSQSEDVAGEHGDQQCLCAFVPNLRREHQPQWQCKEHGLGHKVHCITISSTV